MHPLRAFAVLLVPGLLAAQTPAFTVVPAKVDAVFKDFGPTTPGCAVGLYNKGKVLYAKGYGMADLNLGIPITPKSVFDIGSTSKQFAAASTVLLANEGKISLSDDVRKYIPELPNYGKTITIDHMLRHTSGIRDYNGLLYLAGHYFEDYTDDDDALAVIVAQRALNFTPGTKWDYSNSGFFLLSVIIKRVTGKTLAEFAKERLLTPLGMTVTHFRTDHTALLPNRAVAYEPGPKGGWVIDMSDWDQTGDGGINTNVLELAKWDANFYDAKVGGRELIDRMQQRGTLDNGDSLSYARGLFVDTYRGLRRIHHGGAWAGYRAMLMRFPNQAFSIGMTCNVGNADTQARAEAVADAVLAAAFKEPKPGAKKAAPGAAASAATFDVAPFAGTYFSEEDQSVVGIVSDQGKPMLAIFGRNMPLESVAADRLAAFNGMLTLDFSADRETAKVAMRGEPMGTFRRTTKATPSASELAELAGTYKSPELLTAWTVRIDGGKVFVKGRAVGDTELDPVIKDGFNGGNGFYAFTRGADGRINGFNVTASRMKNIRFDR